jgi:predicted O-methyltransferase YrrM
VATVDRVDSEIQALLADKSAFPASIEPSVALYLYNLVRTESPLLAVEVGCCRGFSTLHIGKALRDLGGSGKLVSFDLAPQEAAERICRAGLGNIVEFVAGNSSREGERFLSRHDQVIDFLFIDGDHTRRGCLLDAAVFLRRLKVGGILVLHDIYPEQCGWLGPRCLIEALQKTVSTTSQPCFTIQEISDLDPFGIAVCRKLTEFSTNGLMTATWYYKSRLAQFIEIANFEGKRTSWEIFWWGLSKWQRIAHHW